jgi:transposase
LKEAEEGKRHVYFVDAAHFVFGAFLSTLWCFTRLFIPTPSGRQRFNVLGALNAVTLKMVTVTNDSYINAWSVADLIKKLRAFHGDEPITLILDNARYQKCKLVTMAANMFNIELLYLPSYSPNLNLIERAWKFVKKKSLYCKVYTDFKDFCKGITSCIDDFDDAYRDEIKSLMTWNFQTLSEATLDTA